MQIISRFEKDNNALITSVESLSKQLLMIFGIPFEILSSHSVVANPTAHQIMGSSLNDSLGNQNIGRPIISRKKAEESKPSAPSPTDPSGDPSKPVLTGKPP